jgi:chromosome segregation protein
MQGFKSFPDKTKLVFENGTTVIVGPNGSGKSNISDAMRWVLGEISTKSIRGTKMEDIIFGGADSRKPMSFAEVSVTFDNTDKEHRLESPFDEVTVTRRYYRAGESEYFINRSPVRLKDIYELFMNTGIGRDGYSIISQGKIAEIISRRSDERRSIFEDASGIAKYRHKKNEAEIKLAATEENMTRIKDIISEVEAQLGPLEKDAEKAKKAIELLEAKKRVDVQLWLYDTEKLRGEVASAEEKFKYSSFDLATAEEALQSYEQQNDKLFEESQNNKKLSAELLEQIRLQTAENYETESRYKLNESEIAHLNELIAESEGAISEIRRAVAAEEEAGRARGEKIDELKKQLEKLQGEHAEATQESAGYGAIAAKLEEATDKALYDLRTLEKEAVDIKVRLSVIENARISSGDKNTSIAGELEGYEKTSKDYSEKCAEKQARIDEYSAQINKSSALIGELIEQIKNINQKLDAVSGEAARLRLERDSCIQRINTFRAMEEQLEGYSNSVRYVMKRYAEGKITNALGIPCGRIYGPLSKLISVEDRFVTATEVALGASLQHIVVEDESVAKSAMLALKRSDAGRATFFPLTSMRGQSPTPEMKEAAGFAGYIGVASELVKCDRKFYDIVSNLLGRTVVFDNIDNATAMAKALHYRVRAVTLDGQQINFGGSFTGGSVKSDGSILGRAGEIKRLEADVEELNRRIADAEAECKLLTEEINGLDERRSSEEQKLKLTDVLRSGEAAGLEQIKAKLDANNMLIDKLRSDIKGIVEQQSRQAQDIEELGIREKDIRRQIEEITAFRFEKDIERNGIIEKKSECDNKAVQIYIRISETQKDIETEQTLESSSGERIRAFLADISERERRVADYKSSVERLMAEQNDNRAAARAGTLELDRLNAERAKTESGGLEFERRLSELNAKIRDKMAQKESIFRDYTQNENRLNQLRKEQEELSTKLWDEYQLTRAEAVALNYPLLDSKTRAEAAAEQISCRNRLRVIGNVDLNAVNKYAEVKARYDSMASQIADLEKSKNELMKIIGDLEKSMESSFIESFNKINDNFNRVFGELFGGGSAQLSLTDPSNILESGIEISAAPPGKIIKNLMQLSGGEQAFVAIALFFAILQVNPTPFCILDEIEAALDEVNVSRFAEYIKKYSDGTQFILITHRRGTMEAANRIYGVTMPEHGISKVLTLNINEISKNKGEEWNGFFG